MPDFIGAPDGIKLRTPMSLKYQFDWSHTRPQKLARVLGHWPISSGQANTARPVEVHRARRLG
jgi:hypothetical protein